MVEEIIVEPRKKEEWEQDQKGHFLIRINSEQNRIEIQFRDNNLKPLINIYGEKPEDIYYKIIKEKLITNLQHAAYLGMELEKAYICLKKDLKYIQDEEIKF